MTTAATAAAASTEDLVEYREETTPRRSFPVWFVCDAEFEALFTSEAFESLGRLDAVVGL